MKACRASWNGIAATSRVKGELVQVLFEIWQGVDGSQSMGIVHPQNDKVRVAIDPGAFLAHSFTARSTFEAFRKYNEWSGFDEWEPPDDLEDHIFSDEEGRLQQEYLRTRPIGSISQRQPGSDRDKGS
jgi:hypothetical protein